MKYVLLFPFYLVAFLGMLVLAIPYVVAYALDSEFRSFSTSYTTVQTDPEG